MASLKTVATKKHTLELSDEEAVAVHDALCSVYYGQELRNSDTQSLISPVIKVLFEGGVYS